MSQPYQNPPQQPPPGWGAPPPPPRPDNSRKIALIIIGSVLALGFITFLGVVISASSKSDKTVVVEDQPADDPKAEEKPAEQPKEEKAEEKPAAEEPVKITAKKTAFSKSIIADSSNYTSVLITITNNSNETISVNPLYFAITDTDGTKHTAELAVDERQIDTVKLAPGENVSGTITGKGKFTPKYVTYTDGWWGDSLRAEVS